MTLSPGEWCVDRGRVRSARTSPQTYNGVQVKPIVFHPSFVLPWLVLNPHMRSLVHRASTSSLPTAQPNRLHPHASNKKRNVERACDACRRRKTRCDGPKMPDNVCTNCIQNSRSCVYLSVLLSPVRLRPLLILALFSEASKPRGPPKA